jgi:hypothetical protein
MAAIGGCKQLHLVVISRASLSPGRRGPPTCAGARAFTLFRLFAAWPCGAGALPFAMKLRRGAKMDGTSAAARSAGALDSGAPRAGVPEKRANCQPRAHAPPPQLLRRKHGAEFL